MYRLRTLRADASRRRSAWALLALYVVVAIAAVGRSLTIAFRSLDTPPRAGLRSAAYNLLAVRVDVRRGGHLHRALGAIATVVGGIVSAAWAAWHLARERRGRRRQVELVLVRRSSSVSRSRGPAWIPG